MGESRQELLNWVNNLLQLNITKVEQMGTGAALCQIYDSIFLDVTMSRVKFNVNAEYLYIANFKVLQSMFKMKPTYSRTPSLEVYQEKDTFTKHQIERSIPIEALVKCKMQDNLEFLQWTKRFWDQYYPGGEYDAIARRKASGAPPSAGGPMGVAPRSGSAAARRAPVTGGASKIGARGAAAGGGAASAALTAENNQLKDTVAGLERERDFYFSKLRDIELLLQQAIEENPEIEKDDGMIKQIQEILYSTEEGFEIPAEAEGEAAGEDLETF